MNTKMWLYLKMFLFFGMFVFLLAQSNPALGQQDPCAGGLGAARLIKPNEQVTINFFKSDSTGKPQGEPLTPEQIEAGFKEGDAVAIRVSAPYCFYIYVVNVSEWDGSELEYPSPPDYSENIGIRAGGTKELGFLLENISKKSALHLTINLLNVQRLQLV